MKKVKKEQFCLSGLVIQRIGFPQTKECGPPYVRFEEGLTGNYLGALDGDSYDRIKVKRLIRWLESTLVDKNGKRK